MTDLVWVGGGSDEASDPTQWLPSQAPQEKDLLLIDSGTMNITGDPLHSTTLFVVDNEAGERPPITFNLTGNATLDQNMLASNHATGSMNFNLIGSNAVFTGGFGSFLTDVFVKGTGTWINGESGINGAKAVIDPAVTGTGQFYVLPAQGKDGSLEFKAAVAEGQTVDVRGDVSNNTHGSLIIDDPAAFAGHINLGFGDVLLEGIKADGFAFGNDMLTLTNGNTVVDTIRLTQVSDNRAGANTLTVTQASNGVLISGHDGVTPMLAADAASSSAGSAAPNIPYVSGLSI